jgi:hypothetical protein
MDAKMTFSMEATLDENDHFIFQIDGYSISDSDWGCVSYELKQIARSCLSPEDKKNTRTEVLKKYNCK